MAMMDPDRVRAYLQVACAGLGFDVGEIWWTSNSCGSSTVAAIEETPSNKRGDNGGAVTVQSPDNGGSGDSRRRRIRFLQLYTSKSYNDRRSQLVQPPAEHSEGDGDGNGSSSSPNSKSFRRLNSQDELGKHVLSPRLVNAVTNTAQVVWANCQRREGLLGRSDMRLQTAVGMPVAMDADGAMCVVVMFSADNVQSSDDAMDYLQSIIRSASSTSIPCLLPALDGRSGMRSITAADHHHREAGQVAGEVLKQHPVECSAACQEFGEGVTARFVSFEDRGDVGGVTGTTEVHAAHEVTQAPKDCYGIPMLPTVAELGSLDARSRPVHETDTGEPSNSRQEYDAFDEASYGVWSTVMDTPEVVYSDPKSGQPFCSGDTTKMQPSIKDSSRNSSSSTVSLLSKPIMAPQRKGRLEEFSSAFLGMSVFDAADVWIPCGGEDHDMLCHVTSVSANPQNNALNYFGRLSVDVGVKIWSGAVGRAYGSGNPVWSANRSVIVDSDRAVAFEQAKIQTAFAVPVFSAGAVTPACVLCCYSLVHYDSVPFVLKFVQQALRLLWEGLDRVEPHESVGAELWRDVAPADLGEMAADTEMQNAFLKKKRPHGVISCADPPQRNGVSASSITTGDARGNSNIDKELRDRSSSLSLQLDSLNMAPGESSSPTEGSPLPPPGMSLGLAPSLPTSVLGTSSASLQTPASPVKQQQVQQQQIPHQQQSYHQQALRAVQNHVEEAVRSVGDAVPWPAVHRGVPTNAEGTKRVHLATEAPTLPSGGALNQLSPTQSLTQQPLVQQQDPQLQCRQHVTTQSQPQQPTPIETNEQRPQIQQPVYYQQQAQSMYQQQPHVPLPQYSQPVAQLQQFAQQQHATPQHAQPQQHATPHHAHPQQHAQPQQPQQPQLVPSQSQYVPVQPQPAPPHQHQQVQIQPHPTHYLHEHQPYVEEQSLAGSVKAPSLNIVHESTSSLRQEISPSHPCKSLLSPPPPHFKEDPVVARANIEAFNAMAQMQGRAGSSAATQNNIHPPQAWSNGSGAPCDQPRDTAAHAAEVLPTAAGATPAPVVLPDSSSSQSNPVATATSQGIGGMVCLPVNQTTAGISHAGLPGSRKICRIQGCDDLAVARRPYCLKHSGNRMCEREGCTKCAQGSTRFCIAHGGGRRCTFPGCDKGARDKFFCAAHGGGKRCNFEGCNKSAVGGSNLCTSHGGGRRCQVEGCDKSAQSSTKFCVKHGGGKKCSHPGCDKVARGRTMFCAAHGGGVRCKLEGCNRVAIGKLQLCRAHGGSSTRKTQKKLQIQHAPEVEQISGGVPNHASGGIIL